MGNWDFCPVQLNQKNDLKNRPLSTITRKKNVMVVYIRIFIKKLKIPPERPTSLQGFSKKIKIPQKYQYSLFAYPLNTITTICRVVRVQIPPNLAQLAPSCGSLALT
ncbi:MAG: hypothetical protein DI539_27240 [Flavobacterium psychrophilum]|nr:MAG: hypothetical protein DI539_27240 [Flavobacterium psychrophilum]